MDRSSTLPNFWPTPVSLTNGSKPARCTTPAPTPQARDVLGTLMLGVLSGSRRHAHLAGIRGGQVVAQALGLNKIAREDSVIEDLDRNWILDLDTTIISLYGHQEGHRIGYNQHRPGRPSHALHTYWVGNLRLVLDMQLHSGKEHSSGLARGDSGYGNQDVIQICE